MEFGKVDNPAEVDFSLPPDHPRTKEALNKGSKQLEVFVGCGKWNKKDLGNLFPKGTKDELSYYSTQFNSIEVNVTYRKHPSKWPLLTWKDKTPDDFKFFPKITNSISLYPRLENVKEKTEEFCQAVSVLEEKLGTIFLQLKEDFKPEWIDRIERFCREFPKGYELAVEVRNAGFFNNPSISEEYFNLLEKYKVSNIITDSAGRRDMLHMRLTSPTAFVRWVGTNHVSDYNRLDDWVERIKIWTGLGLEKLCFFVHQNIEVESPALSKYFLDKLNSELNANFKVPTIIKK